MPLERTAVFAKIVECVSPYLGQTMAEAAVEAQRERLGLQGERVTAQEVEALTSRIGMGLIIFVGREKAAQIVGQIQDQVRSLAGGES
jgi:hypothetical protein